MDDMIKTGTVNGEMAEFLIGAVRSRLNIIISGGTGTGKTTLLNVLSSFIGSDERIVTIEDAAELRLQQPDIVALESRPANTDGRGQISIRDLVRNALRMRPDRIIVGEARSGEALDMLQAMNTGHDGSITTVHANNPREALNRVETMVLMAGMDLPVRAIRSQVAEGIHLIVHVARLLDGTRKVVAITEIQGLEGDTITLEEIFRYDQVSFDGVRVHGQFVVTGIRPKCYAAFERAGQYLNPRVFGHAGILS
jgi:pilus assembly protein CpaF